MPERIDPAANFVRSRGKGIRAVTYRAYDPEADDHADPGESGSGYRGPLTVAFDNGQPVPAREWTLTGLTTTPVTGGLVVDATGGETWVIRSVDSDPASGEVHRCQCVRG